MNIGLTPEIPADPLSLPVRVQSLASGFSVEATTSAAAGIASFAEILPRGTEVYVPHMPGGAYEDGIALCRRLAEDGMVPVAHVAARAVPDEETLNGWFGQLADAGCGAILLIAGDRPAPAGPYETTLDVIESGLLLKHGIRRIGVAGHPEGHPFASDDDLSRALERKIAYARDTETEMWIVTQFVFSADPVLRWLDRLEGESCPLPVRVGLPGPANLRTVMKFALQCGVGNSARILSRRPDTLRRLTRAWTPDRLLTGLAAATVPAAVHVFAFGGVKRSAEWFGAIRDGRFRVAPDGRRLSVDVD